MRRAGLPCDICGEKPTRRFINSDLCDRCAPIVPQPDPTRTAEALSARAAIARTIGRAIGPVSSTPVDSPVDGA